jgi:hypothetical protein
MVNNATNYTKGIMNTMIPIIAKNDSYHFSIKFSMIKKDWLLGEVTLN